MEQSFRQQEDRNRELEEQVHRTHRQDLDTQDKLENRALENASLKKALKDLEQKAKVNQRFHCTRVVWCGKVWVAVFFVCILSLEMVTCKRKQLVELKNTIYKNTTL